MHSNGSLYIANMAHVMYQCLQAISDSIGSLINAGANGGLPALMSACWNIPNDTQLLWE